MCGIIFDSNKNVNAFVLAQYLSQQTRGVEGFGFAGVSNGKLDVFKSIDEPSVIAELVNKPYSLMLFHHRTPTSTKNVLNACHPFEVTIDGVTYITAHNGIICNDDELYLEQVKRGFTFTSRQFDGTFNDSETLAIDIAEYLAGKKKRLSVKGMIAFITLITVKGKVIEVVFGRNSLAPLMLSTDGKRIASEGLVGVDCKPIKVNKLYRMDTKTGDITYSSLKISDEWTYKSSYVTPKTSKWYLDDDTIDDVYNGDGKTVAELEGLIKQEDERIKKLEGKPSLSKKQRRKLSNAYSRYDAYCEEIEGRHKTDTDPYMGYREQATPLM